MGNFKTIEKYSDQLAKETKKNCNADIVVNVKVKGDNIGRGEFLFQK